MFSRKELQSKREHVSHMLVLVERVTYQIERKITVPLEMVLYWKSLQWKTIYNNLTEMDVDTHLSELIFGG